MGVKLFFSQEVIDLKVENNKKTDTPLDLSKKQVELYNGRFSQFIMALKSSDRKKDGELLSENAKKQCNRSGLQKLSSDINSNKKMEIIRTGYKPLINGNNYPMIQYKYADDKSDEPKEVITAVFENDGKNSWDKTI